MPSMMFYIVLLKSQGKEFNGKSQRRHIGIARALYHNPEIIIMDEATAALDNTTDRQFRRAEEAEAKFQEL